MWLETAKKKMKEKKKALIFQLYMWRKGVVNKIMYFKITKILLRQLIHQWLFEKIW